MSRTVSKLAYSMAESEVASGMSRRALENAIKDGRLRSSLVGGRRQIFPNDLEEFLRGGQPRVGEQLASPRMRPNSPRRLCARPFAPDRPQPMPRPILRGRRDSTDLFQKHRGRTPRSGRSSISLRGRPIFSKRATRASSHHMSNTTDDPAKRPDCPRG